MFFWSVNKASAVLAGNYSRKAISFHPLRRFPNRDVSGDSEDVVTPVGARASRQSEWQESKMADEDVTLDGKSLQSLRVADLKAALEHRHLPKSGAKNALIKRLKGVSLAPVIASTDELVKLSRRREWIIGRGSGAGINNIRHAFGGFQVWQIIRRCVEISRTNCIIVFCGATHFKVEMCCTDRTEGPFGACVNASELSSSSSVVGPALCERKRGQGD